MKSFLYRFPVAFAAALACLALSSGCEVDDDDYDHDPPAGLGSIVIENYTSTDIELFVNGRLIGEIDEDDDSVFDLRPGVYRVVLNDDDGDRSWADEVDVLEGKLTVLNVRIDTSYFDSYTVSPEIQ